MSHVIADRDLSSKNASHLKHTTSRCPSCYASVAAEVIESDGRVFMNRQCDEHGGFSACISSDSRFYHEDPGLSAKGSHSPRQNPTCIALIEVVDSCNLSCPTCFASSPRSSGKSASIAAVPLEELKQRIEHVVADKGSIDILQLSGGEPTLHPQLMELLEYTQNHELIGHTLINTNGVRLAKDSDFAAALSKAFKPGRLQLYLQFDGRQISGQKELRGADLREIRKRVIEVTAKMGCQGLPITLAMTIIPENLNQIWDTIEFGLAYNHIRGITIQPFFSSGRSVHHKKTIPPKINVADIAHSLIENSKGILTPEDLPPLPCGSPNCATIGYLLKTAKGPESLRKYIDYGQASDKIKDRLNFNLDDLSKCSCSPTEIDSLNVSESQTFRISIKPFMDAWSWDEDRIKQCCTHVIRKDGTLDSFCRYYSGYPEVIK